MLAMLACSPRNNEMADSNPASDAFAFSQLTSFHEYFTLCNGDKKIFVNPRKYTGSSAASKISVIEIFFFLEWKPVWYSSYRFRREEMLSVPYPTRSWTLYLQHGSQKCWTLHQGFPFKIRDGKNGNGKYY